jgi:5-methylcytosine-specific restriction endonuclease McrA
MTTHAVRIVVVMEFMADPKQGSRQGGEIAETVLGNLPESMIDRIVEVSFQVQAGKMQRRCVNHANTWTIVSEQDVDEVFAAGGMIVDGTKHKLPKNQQFFRSPDRRRCLSCGLTGTRMLLRKHPKKDIWSINLCGCRDDRNVMITRDHRIPKYCGGRSLKDNIQVLCEECNLVKGNMMMTLQQLQKLAARNGIPTVESWRSYSVDTNQVGVLD